MAKDDPRVDDQSSEDCGHQERIGGPLRNSEQHYRDLIGAANQVLYRHNADWSEMRQLAGGGFLADRAA